MSKVIKQAIATLREDPAVDAAYNNQHDIVRMAKLLRTLRTGANKTQADLAAAMGTSQSTISRLESFDNAHMPQIETVREWAHKCGRNLYIGGEPDGVPVEPEKMLIL